MRTWLLLPLFVTLPFDKDSGEGVPTPSPVVQDPAQADATSDLPPGANDPARQAIERGLAWLAKDLETSATGASATGDPTYAAPVGVTALSTLAFLASGSTARRGPYQREVARQLDYLLERVAGEEDKYPGFVHATEDHQSKMHGHGLALLAFTQAYNLSPRSPRGKRLAKAIQLGVARVEASQGEDGGWYYEPVSWELTEGSVTVCMLWALRGARNSGFEVDSGVIDRALAYVKTLQEENGGFIYAPHEPRSSVALTAACLSTLHAMGVYEGREIDDGYDYIWRELAARSRVEVSPFPFYERWYLAQCLWQHRDTQVFQRWSKEEWLRIYRAQRADGAWTDARYDSSGVKIEGRFGTTYATAMNVLVLSVPEGLLPAFQR